MVVEFIFSIVAVDNQSRTNPTEWCKFNYHYSFYTTNRGYQILNQSTEYDPEKIIKIFGKGEFYLKKVKGYMVTNINMFL